MWWTQQGRNYGLIKTTLIPVLKTDKYLRVVFLHCGPTTEAWKAGGERKHVIWSCWFNERKQRCTEPLLHAMPWAWTSVKPPPLFMRWALPRSSCHGGGKRIRGAESVIQVGSSGAGVRTQSFLTPNLYSLPSTHSGRLSDTITKGLSRTLLGLFSSVTELSQALPHHTVFDLKGRCTDEDTEASSR